MQFHKQLNKHNPEKRQWGDCHRTAIACVLDLHPSDVPHFNHGGPGAAEVNEHIKRWLLSRGLMSISIAFPGETPLDDILRSVAVANYEYPDLCYLLGGRSRTGVNHTVVCRGEKIIHDPSQVDAGIIGPTQPDKLYWITFFGTALALADTKAEAA